MTITASLVKELRELTGAGMMECKKALVETKGDLEAAQEYLRKSGQASAAKKSGRIAAEGRIELATGDDVAAIVEVNCETDFVAKDENFIAFARRAAQLVVDRRPADVAALMALPADGATFEDARNALVAKIGENVGVRRFETIAPQGQVASYLHGVKIGVIVDVDGGDQELGRDIAMHIAATSPAFIGPEDVPAEAQKKERKILADQAAQEGKPANIVEKMVEGRMRKYLGEITLLGQPFVKDPDVSVGKLLDQSGATVKGYYRLEVGEGIEKKAENFAEEVQAQVNAQA
ncbi:MAG: elongation factor Ts [Gammaproteobacteria bacterium]|nr:elongation factor Ts [Gammaproteobacteria bacterium]MBT8443703.1 elongation factor Ts [Gammaproteobacteria bacterium]NND35618.1 elongation factor Ts [Gammaproteobacteria bacterium]